MTTALFRCGGMGRQSVRHDRLGAHDIAWWLVVGALGAAWYFMLFEPQRQRNEMLQGRLDVLNTQLMAEQIELRRMAREVRALERDDPRAWERAARARLGWLQPNEVLDVRRWRQERIAAGHPDPLPGMRPDPAEEQPFQLSRAIAATVRRAEAQRREREARREPSPESHFPSQSPRDSRPPGRDNPTRTASALWDP